MDREAASAHLLKLQLLHSPVSTYVQFSRRSICDLEYLFVEIVRQKPAVVGAGGWFGTWLVHSGSMRPKARGLAHHGSPPGWLLESDRAGCDFVSDERYVPPALTDHTTCPAV
jgi:hypothetical protein